jgi:excinuclease UvrABC helicase subunit UvrB
MQSFDELFNDFFDRKNHKPQKRVQNSTNQNDEIKKIIDMLMNGSLVDVESMTEKLGEPDNVENYIENGLHYRKLVWNTPRGQFVKIIASEEKIVDEPKKSLTLEERLKIAEEDEDYELAIQLRDEIKNLSKKNKKSL